MKRINSKRTRKGSRPSKGTAARGALRAADHKEDQQQENQKRQQIIKRNSSKRTIQRISTNRIIYGNNSKRTI